MAVLARPRTWFTIGRTVALMAAVSATAVAVAVPLAWWTTCADLPGRRWWSIALALPVVIPSYVMAYLTLALLSPRGLVQQALAPLGVTRLPSIYGFPGAWLVLSLHTYPFVYLAAQGALRRLDPSLGEASRGLGRGALATFWHVTLPGLRPAISAGALLVALYTLRDFGAVAAMGADTLPRAIFLIYQASHDRAGAAMLSLVAVAVALAVLASERATAPRRRRYAAATARAALAPACVPLGRWRPLAVSCCAIVAALGVVMPGGVLLYWLGRGWAGGQVLPGERLMTAAGHSMLAGALAAGLTAAAALPVAVAARGWPGAAGRWLGRLPYVGLALPSLTVALAMVFVGLGLAPALYGTLTLLVLAYAVLFLPQAVGYDEAALARVPPALEESARSLGRTAGGVLRTVTLPLAAPGILAGAALVYLTTVEELPVTLLLSPLRYGPTGFQTLATEVWSAVAESMYAKAAAPALGIIVCASVPSALLLLGAAGRRGGGR